MTNIECFVELMKETAIAAVVGFSGIAIFIKTMTFVVSTIQNLFA